MKNKIYIVIFNCLLIFTFPSKSQQTLSAMQAYDKAQNARHNALALWGKDSATQKDITEGINILKNALLFLDSFPINELAAGNIYLKARKHVVAVPSLRTLFCSQSGFMGNRIIPPIV